MTGVVTAVSQAAGVDAPEAHPGFGVLRPGVRGRAGARSAARAGARNGRARGTGLHPRRGGAVLHLPGGQSRYPRTWYRGCVRQAARPGRSQLPSRSLAAVGRPARVNMPNGMAHHIVVFDVRDGRYLAGAPVRRHYPRVPGRAQGGPRGPRLCVFVRQVQVFSPAGDRAGQINLPGAVNFTFGGPGGEVLLITTDAAIWADFDPTGAQPRAAWQAPMSAVAGAPGHA